MDSQGQAAPPSPPPPQGSGFRKAWLGLHPFVEVPEACLSPVPGTALDHIPPGGFGNMIIGA